MGTGGRRGHLNRQPDGPGSSAEHGDQAQGDRVGARDRDGALGAASGQRETGAAMAAPDSRERAWQGWRQTPAVHFPPNT